MSQVNEYLSKHKDYFLDASFRRILAGGIMLLMFACTSGPGSQYRSKPKALGVANQITVICEDKLWEGQVGDSLSYYLESVYPVLPRPEPLFDVRHFTAFEIQVEELRRELRTYLICVNTRDTSSRTYKLVEKHLGAEALDVDTAKLKRIRDKWATDQLVLYFLAPGEDALANAVSAYFPKISEQVREHDLKQIKAKTYLQKENREAIKTIEDKLGVHMRIPGDYIIAVEEDSLIWLRKDYEDITVNLMLQLLDYNSQEQFSRAYMKKIRDAFGLQYVSSSSDGSYMRINDEDLPMYVFKREINGHYTLEARGIWEMENDFMGGPFVSYLIHLKERDALLFVDGFVLAPGHKKKEIMQQLEVIVGTLGKKSDKQ
ncbi:MAG: DUF4837 family protein [Saprospiraceae bacterium]|nr:DUF4837 family protein [Saprospiraceae bacterium]